MNLRKRQHEKGFYFLSHNGLLEKKFQISPLKEKPRKLNKKEELGKNMDSLNCKILSKLISSSRRSPIVKGEMELSVALNNYLRFSYDLTGRFQGSDF